MKTTVAIICRDDPQLSGTVQSLLDTVKGRARVIVLYDGAQSRPRYLPPSVETATPWTKARGTSAMRHAAVMHADTPYVVTCDSHMGFPQGWLEAFESELDEYPNAVVCPICDCVDPKTGDAKPHYAAKLHWFADHDPHKGTNRQPGERVAVTGRWRIRPDIEPGPVECIMGACYGVNRAWYNHIGEPWKYGYGWGSDEESISLASSFCGGHSRMIDTHIRHLTQTRMTYMPSKDHNTAVWYNRLRLVRGYPHEEDYARKLEDWLFSSSEFQGQRGRYLKKGIEQICRQTQLTKLHEHLQRRRP